MLIEAKLFLFYWGETVTAAVYLYNKILNKCLNWLSPYEAKYGKRLNLNNIKIWSSLVYM